MSSINTIDELKHVRVQNLLSLELAAERFSAPFSGKNKKIVDAYNYITDRVNDVLCDLNLTNIEPGKDILTLETEVEYFALVTQVEETATRLLSK